MGRASRRKAQRRAETPLKDSALRVTVVAQPSSHCSRDWAEPHDLLLVRSALLYADSIELLSQRYSWAKLGDALSGAALRVGDGIVNEQSNILTDFAEGKLPRGSPLDTAIRDKVRRRKIDKTLPLTQFREEFLRAQALDRAEEEADRNSVAIRTGLKEFQRLEQEGLLEVREDGLNFMPGPQTGFNPMVWELGWWHELLQRIQSPETRLLLDTASERRLIELSDVGLVQPSTLIREHAGEASVGAGLVARLPAFPSAPVDELLDLREDLREPLVRYRAAVKQMAKEGAFGIHADTQAKLNDLWLGSVEPALLNIEEQLRDHGLVREMAKSASKDVKTFLAQGTAIFVGIGAFTDLATWLAGVAGVAAPGAQAAAAGWVASQEGKVAARRADLFYLYAARQAFEKRPRLR